ncbi:MAG: hypothetical protein KY433_12295, partial [Actinobacteria bacterium]|nr:hypothetical protein [Actinomycetota bacterium]
RQNRIVVHRAQVHAPGDTMKFHGIPFTAAERVLLDLAPRLPLAELTRAAHEAWIRYGTSPAGVERCIGRNPTKKGAAKLRRALGSDVTLSDLEDGFLELLARHHLPRPRTNIDRAGDKVDCHWADRGLTVELLSFRFHGTRRAFEDDVARRRRSNHLAYTYGDITDRGVPTAAERRPLLTAGAVHSA